MNPLRFGKVAAIQNFKKDAAKRLVGPNNRVIYQERHSRAFLVTGQEDINLVDQLEMGRKQAIKEGDADAAWEILLSLYRFLCMEGYKETQSTNAATRENCGPALEFLSC